MKHVLLFDRRDPGRRRCPRSGAARAAAGAAVRPRHDHRRHPDLARPDLAQGKKLTIGLTKDWTVSVTKSVTAAEILPGSFIGTAEMPCRWRRPLEVHVFPPGVKLVEGHYGWDLKKGSMMTNGTVGKVVASKSGSAFDVSYSTGVRHIVVLPKTPIVQIVPSSRALIKPAKVFMAAIPTLGGLIANSVAVGETARRRRCKEGSRMRPDRADLPGGRLLIYRYPVLARITHWVNLASMVVLLLSGLQILCSHPAFYWGETAVFAHPFAEIVSGTRPAGRTSAG